jgi:hypothetical protein
MTTCARQVSGLFNAAAVMTAIAILTQKASPMAILVLAGTVLYRTKGLVTIITLTMQRRKYLMSVADHFNHAPEAACVRVYDTRAARRQFQVSMILVLILTFAAFAFGLLVRFDAVKGEPVTAALSRTHQVKFASSSMNVRL